MYSLRPILILYALLVGGKATLQTFYSGSISCPSSPRIRLISSIPCNAATCADLNGLAKVTTECTNTYDRPPAGVSLEVWATSTTCGGAPDSIVYMTNFTCSGFWSGATILMNCGGTGSIQDCGASVASCNGCPSKPATKGGACITGNPTTSFAIASYKFTCPASGVLLMASWLILLTFLL